MDDVKDKFKGFIKKVNNQLSSSSSSTNFKGQGRVLGSGPVNPNPNPNQVRPIVGTQIINSNPPSKITKPSSSGVQNVSVSVSDQVLISNPNPQNVDGFDPFDSYYTTGKRNKNGFSLDVFECPVCNFGFSSEEQVSLHIETCIDPDSSKINGGEVDLGSVNDTENKLDCCVGTYLSGNPSEGSLEIVLRLLRNVVKEPENPKFRRVRMSNPKIREAVGEVLGGIELLECVGFRLNEEDGEMWAVMDCPSEENVLILNESIRLLERRKNVEGMSSLSTSVVKENEKVETNIVKQSKPEVVDRQIKVFFSVPERVAARIELPDSFYKLSLEEVRREAEMRKKKMAESQLLIPKSFREKQAQAAKKRYNRAVIRVHFPDGVVLQGFFSPREPTSALYEFVSAALKQPGLEFELVHPVPVKRRVIPCFAMAGGRGSTLEEENLVPSALVKFKPIETDSIVFTGLTNELLELSEPLGSSNS